MGRLTSAVLGAAMAIGLSACATISARSDYDRSADFTGFHTFAWISDPPVIVAASDMPISELNLRRIRESIESELVGKGFERAGSPNAADFVISATVGARDHIDVSAYPDPYRGAWGWHSGYGIGTNVAVDTYLEGTLAIDVFDQSAKQAVWHGWAQKRITDADIEDASEPIRNAVTAILSDFPPR